MKSSSYINLQLNCTTAFPPENDGTSVCSRCAACTPPILSYRLLNTGKLGLKFIKICFIVAIFLLHLVHAYKQNTFLHCKCMTTCTIGAIAWMSIRGQQFSWHQCFNAISVHVNMVKRANNIWLLMLKYFGLSGPPWKASSEAQGASENCHLKYFGWNSTCVILFINIFIQNHIKVLWRAEALF